MTRSMERLRASQRRRSDERFAERFAHQWAQLRAERRQEEPPASRPGSRTSRVPRCRTASTSPRRGRWRFLVIVAAGYVILLGISLFEVVVLPLVIALLFTALGVPLVTAHAPGRLPPRRWPRSWS